MANEQAIQFRYIPTLQQWFEFPEHKPEENYDVWGVRSTGEVERLWFMKGAFRFSMVKREDVTHWCYVQPPRFKPNDPDNPVKAIETLLGGLISLTDDDADPTKPVIVEMTPEAGKALELLTSIAGGAFEESKQK